MILTTLVIVPLNIFTFLAFTVGFIYLATHIGSKEHAGWLGSKEMFMVAALVVVLLCIGLAPDQIWHLIMGGH